MGRFRHAGLMRWSHIGKLEQQIAVGPYVVPRDLSNEFPVEVSSGPTWTEVACDSVLPFSFGFDDVLISFFCVARLLL